MTGQNDRQDESLNGQVRDQARHCPLTGRYFQPWNTYLVINITTYLPISTKIAWTKEKSAHNVIPAKTNGHRKLLQSLLFILFSMINSEKW